MDTLREQLHSFNSLLAEFLITLLFSFLGVALIGVILLGIVALIASAVTIWSNRGE